MAHLSEGANPVRDDKNWQQDVARLLTARYNNIMLLLKKRRLL